MTVRDLASGKESAIPKFKCHTQFHHVKKWSGVDYDALDNGLVAFVKSGFTFMPHAYGVQSLHSVHPHGNPAVPV